MTTFTDEMKDEWIEHARSSDFSVDYIDAYEFFLSKFHQYRQELSNEINAVKEKAAAYPMIIQGDGKIVEMTEYNRGFENALEIVLSLLSGSEK